MFTPPAAKETTLGADATAQLWETLLLADLKAYLKQKKIFYFLYIDRNFKACLLNYWKLKKTVPLNDSIFQITT